MKRSQKLKWVIGELKQAYPDVRCALSFSTPFQLLVATILSAQCTDERVNQVTPTLFKKYPDLQSFANARLEDLQSDIHSTGFYRNKALAIQDAAQQIITLHQGIVPNSLSALTAIKGVGRKTASVVMGNAYGTPDGVVVDTHISRLSQRLGLTLQKTPEKIELDLMQSLPRKHWVIFPHLLISHGRAVCKARKPLCHQCVLIQHCPSRQ